MAEGLKRRAEESRQLITAEVGSPITYPRRVQVDLRQSFLPDATPGFD